MPRFEYCLEGGFRARTTISDTSIDQLREQLSNADFITCRDPDGNDFVLRTDSVVLLTEVDQ